MTVTAAQRKRILARDFGRCQMCGRKPRDTMLLDIDHIQPVSKSGSSEDANLRAICREHNRARGNRETWQLHDRPKSRLPSRKLPTGRKLPKRVRVGK